MTTSVTDQMVEAAWVEFHCSHKGLGRETDLHRARRCLEAALRIQGKVVIVEKLKSLQPYFIDWRYEELEPCEWDSAGTTVVKINDLTAIIGEGD